MKFWKSVIRKVLRRIFIFICTRENPDRIRDKIAEGGEGSFIGIFRRCDVIAMRQKSNPNNEINNFQNDLCLALFLSRAKIHKHFVQQIKFNRIPRSSCHCLSLCCVKNL